MMIELIASDSVKNNVCFMCVCVRRDVRRHSLASQLFSRFQSLVRFQANTHRELIGGPTATITISDALNFRQSKTPN